MCINCEVTYLGKHIKFECSFHQACSFMRVHVAKAGDILYFYICINMTLYACIYVLNVYVIYMCILTYVIYIGIDNVYIP